VHFLPNTDDSDAAAESFWPENYKEVIREDVCRLLRVHLNGMKLSRIYKLQYSQEYASLSQFVDRVADMVTIGAENGTDDAFDDIYTAFLTESPLPEVRQYALYFLRRAFPRRVQKVIHQSVVNEYSQERVYRYAYEVGYQGAYRSFAEFITNVAQLVVVGAVNGADDMLGRIYRSFVTRCPLPPARRHPKRLKSW